MRLQRLSILTEPIIDLTELGQRFGFGATVSRRMPAGLQTQITFKGFLWTKDDPGSQPPARFSIFGDFAGLGRSRCAFDLAGADSAIDAENGANQSSSTKFTG